MKPLLASMLLFGVLTYSTTTNAQVETEQEPGSDLTAFGCQYTGNWQSGCMYGGYHISRCQHSWQTSCAFYP